MEIFKKENQVIPDLVSIVTPTFNSAKYVLDTYQSICQQDYKAWEWVVTDDQSTDDTWEMLQQICKQDPRVKTYRNQVNSGGAVTRNCSLGHAVGEFVAFVDSDDLWKPDKLTKQIAFMQDGIDFSFTAYEIIDENGRPLGRTVDTSFEGSVDHRDMLMKKATLGCSTVILRRLAFEGLRMPNIRKGQDYAFWLSILRNGGRAHILNEVLTQYRITPNSVSRNKILKSLAQWRIYREFEKLPLIDSAYYFVSYARNAVFRRK